MGHRIGAILPIVPRANMARYPEVALVADIRKQDPLSPFVDGWVCFELGLDVCEFGPIVMI